ncbi:hypothetical protein M0811_09950 [Anaeramoeba ignava]|uniref:Uncharacterized protein n=1 Tax=Anaeramoeba ignava TaxID=1746090 RepID=A0A9Q0LH67_ANAIG|nr:hypothetical protein M0811_09950 [Anaeramoeba ignava]
MRYFHSECYLSMKSSGEYLNRIMLTKDGQNSLKNSDIENFISCLFNLEKKENILILPKPKYYCAAEWNRYLKQKPKEKEKEERNK